MDRRNFFRILSASSAGALAGGCGSKTDKLIPLLVPEHEIVPGEEQWHPAACTECSAGCGTLVRVMEAERTIEHNGERVRERIAAIKKIEGNPLDPVSGGSLCARGQAAVQSLYHPDRLRGPMKRTAERGKAQFTGISWDEALASATETIAKVRGADPGGIAVLTGPPTSADSMSLERFNKALGVPAPVVCSIADFAIERRAAELVFGQKGLPVYDLANAHHVLGVGADFLGGWTSPVYYSRQFGHFRQGRPTVRGHLVQAESRLSITASAADRWVPLRPGSEAQFLVAIGKLLLDMGLARDTKAIPPAVLATFQDANPERLLSNCGVPADRAREAAKELGESDAPLVVGGASTVHTNSVASVAASHYLNALLGNIDRKGGVMVRPDRAPGIFEGRAPEALARARVVIIDDANPAYTMPRSSGVLEALSRAELVLSFSPFVDDSAAWSDLLLPRDHPLESEVALLSAAGATIGMPFVQPLYDTRPLGRILADLARTLNAEYQPADAKDIAQPLLAADLSFDDAARQGGIWPEQRREEAAHVAGSLELAAPAFEGDAAQFPLQFQPYLSLQFHDGRGANLPWMQELPDPASSAIWGLPIEIDPGTARQLRIANGDIVRVQSAHGGIEAPAYVHPGAVPGVLSMAIGDGHSHYGQYASGRGGNPLSILAPVWEKYTGALALGATRVKLTRVGGAGKWIQFAAPDREVREHGHR
jgi:anaerobic selenocysteine-containing dehydrogenase